MLQNKITYISKKTPIMEKETRRNKRIFKLSIWKVKKKEFWIECITLYTSILIVTLFVQAIILKVEPGILIFCLIKSLVTTFGNVIIIMLGRRIAFVQKHWFIETVLYTIASIPYIEISTIYVYTHNFPLSVEMTKWYAIAYFIMGLGIKKYLRLAKKIVTRFLTKRTKKPAYLWSGFFLFSIKINHFFTTFIINDIKRCMVHKSKWIGDNDTIMGHMIKYSIFYSNKLFRPKIYIDIFITLQLRFFEIRSNEFYMA